MILKTIDDATPQEWDKLRNSSKETTSTPIADAWHSVYDNVNKPKHYNNGSLECIEAIKAMLTPDEYIGYLRGNSLKYRWRFRYKDKPVEDLRKARWYEEKLLQFIMDNPDVT